MSAEPRRLARCMRKREAIPSQMRLRVSLVAQLAAEATMLKAAGCLRVAAVLATLVGTGVVAQTAAKDRTKKGPETFTITLRVYDYVRMNRPALLAAEGEA